MTSVSVLAVTWINVVLFVVLGGLALVGWALALYDLFTNHERKLGWRIATIVLLIIIPILGPLFYFYLKVTAGSPPSETMPAYHAPVEEFHGRTMEDHYHNLNVLRSEGALDEEEYRRAVERLSARAEPDPTAPHDDFDEF